jgi:hypothetical protein
MRCRGKFVMVVLRQKRLLRMRSRICGPRLFLWPLETHLDQMAVWLHSPCRPPAYDHAASCTRCHGLMVIGRLSAPFVALWVRTVVSKHGRCRLHGGAPGTGAPSGKRNGSWKHGRYSQESIELRRLIRKLMREARATMAGAGL